VNQSSPGSHPWHLGTTNAVVGGNAAISTLTADLATNATYLGAFVARNKPKSDFTDETGAGVLSVTGTNNTN